MSQYQKRPRADTESHVPPLPRKPRVDDADFSLFDEGDLSDLDQSLFDGQLSDSDLSDWASEFSPSDSESELGLDMGNVSLTGPLGNWEGVRKAQNAYKLPGVSENLEGPAKGMDLQAVKLSDTEKDVARKFTTYLVRNWPGSLNTDLVESRNLALADPTAFWK